MAYTVSFAEYSNSLAAMAKEKGLQPMAFNDGFYYEDKDDVEFDKDVIISYWSKGWWGYNLASPQYLASKGYKFLTLTETGTISSVKNLKMVEASSRKLSKTLKNSIQPAKLQLNILKLTYLLLVVC